MSSSPRRLHPAGVVLEALRSFREVALPAVVVFAVSAIGGGSAADALLRAAGFAVLIAAVAGVTGYASWRATTYQVTQGAVRLRRGVFRVNETTIPVERVQSVDTLRGPVQRLFGVLELQLQAAGGGKTAEIRLSAVAPAEAAELRNALGVREPGAAPEEGERPPPFRRLGFGRLTAAALTAGQLGVIVPVLLGGFQMLDDVLGPRADEVGMNLVPDSLGELALLLGVVAVAAWLLSIAGAIVAFTRFTVTRDGDRIRITRGLVQRRVSTLPVARIHAVRVVDGILRQPFGFTAVRVESAAHAAEPAAAQTMFPLLRRSELPAFLAELLPELAADLAPLERPPRRALRRYVLPPLLGPLVAAGALAFVLPAAAIAALGLTALGALYGVLRYRAAGWRLTDGRLVVRSRRLARSTVVAVARRLEEREVRQNPLQRRSRLATFAFAVGSRARFAVADLEERTARGLLDRLRPPPGGAGVPERAFARAPSAGGDRPGATRVVAE